MKNWTQKRRVIDSILLLLVIGLFIGAAVTGPQPLWLHFFWSAAAAIYIRDLIKSFQKPELPKAYRPPENEAR